MPYVETDHVSKHPYSLGFRLTVIIVRAITKALGTRKTTSLLSHMMQMAIGSKPFILTPLRRSKHSLHSLGCLADLPANVASGWT